MLTHSINLENSTNYNIYMFAENYWFYFAEQKNNNIHSNNTLQMTIQHSSKPLKKLEYAELFSWLYLCRAAKQELIFTAFYIADV